MSAIFSVLIPAYNEEKYLPRTLAAIHCSAAELGEPVEIIVGNNASTDATERTAREGGAEVVLVEKRCIATARNGAASIAHGKYYVFVDADDLIAPNMLVEIKKVLDSGRYIGGGVSKVNFERHSLGIVFQMYLTNFVTQLLHGVSTRIFFCGAETFNELGGFDERLRIKEDIDFAKRLRRLGLEKGLRYKILRSAAVTRSTRKFDKYGDWLIFSHPLLAIRAMRQDPEVIEEFWYNPKR
jgi:glycosyltransferase involved in cell wall biosynthesis